jgi:hypothetical protein
VVGQDSRKTHYDSEAVNLIVLILEAVFALERMPPSVGGARLPKDHRP